MDAQQIVVSLFVILVLGVVASTACSAFAAWCCLQTVRALSTFGDLDDSDEAIDVRCNCCNFVGCLEWHEDPDDTLCPNCGLLALDEIEVPSE